MSITFLSLRQAIDEATERNCQLADIALEYELENSEASAEEILGALNRALYVMRQSRSQGLERQEPSFSGLTGAEAFRLNAAVSQDNTQGALLGSVAHSALAGALAIAQMNAAMGKIVATPTAGSCGILPGALLAVAEARNLDDSLIVRALLTASGIGLTIAKQASIAGASGGCQAECGSASAMAAGAIVELLGGTPEQAGHAAALAIKSVLGLICDPVAGLVEIPCVKRNGFGAVQALVAAELALANIPSAIPIDEVIDVMREVGQNMPACYRETAEGGLATTPTGLMMRMQLYSDGTESA